MVSLKSFLLSVSSNRNFLNLSTAIDEISELFLIKKLELFIDALAGLGENMWKSVGVV